MPILLAALALTVLPNAAVARQGVSWSGFGVPSQPHCDIVVKRGGGNPTQDMTGSIGHAKSHQSNGGVRNPRVCYLSGVR